MKTSIRAFAAGLLALAAAAMASATNNPLVRRRGDVP
jgi:hypothetical protein